MPKRIAEVIGVSEKVLKDAGVFNGFVDIDSRLYVDPRLLRNSEAPELKVGYEHLTKYFRGIFSILRNSRTKEDAMWRQARKLLTFREKPIMALGYSINGIEGRAIGNQLADNLTNTAHEIIKAGIIDPTIFDLVGLLESGIGPDRISDMVVAIIFNDLLKYSERTARQVGLSRHKYGNFMLSYDPTTENPIILIPEDVLSNLPIAFDWDSRDYICAYNEELRSKVNPIIGKTWKQASRVKKTELKKLMFRYPELIQDAIRIYKRKHPHKYNFEEDPSGEFAWNALAMKYTGKYPLSLHEINIDGPEKVYSLVEKICEKYKVLVEENGLWEVFWYKSKLRNERIAQLSLFGVADAYCEANNIDISRESNGGRGPVDFKYSSGYKARVTVEVKYSTNPKLWNGWEKQLPTYNKAEKTRYSIFLIIRTSNRFKTIEKIKASEMEAKKQGQKVPGVIVIDGRPTESASHT
jgi:hypothetical protein